MILRGTPSFPHPSRILLIQPRRIGDVLLCTPAIRALSSAFPFSKIDFVVESPASEALEGNPFLDRLLVVPGDGGVRSFIAAARRIREQRYDWAIDFFSNPRSAQFAFVSGARIRVGLDRRGRRWAYTHRIVEEASDRDSYAVDLRLRVLTMLGVPGNGRGLEVYADMVNPTETARVRSLLEFIPKDKPLIALAAGNSNPAKRYSSEQTARIIQLLRADGIHVVVTSGPGETALAEEALAAVREPVPFISEARVATLAALYRHISVYVGPDSAPKHIAVACGKPTVTYFGPGRPQCWNDSLNPKNVLLLPPDRIPEDMDADEFLRRKYLWRISPEDIVEAVKNLL